MQEIVEQITTYFRGIWRYRWYAVICAWLITMGGWFFVAKMPDQYVASARVHVDTESILKPLLQGLAVQADVRQRLELLTRTLLSRPNLEKVVRMVDLDLGVTTDEEMEALLDDLQNNITLSSYRRDANLYTISYTHYNPQIAKHVVQSLLTIFVETALGETRQDSDVAKRFLDQQIKEYEVKLLEAENRLKEFKRQNIGLMPSSGQDYFSRLQASQEELSRAQLLLEEEVRRRDELRRQLEGEQPVFGGGRSAANISHPLDRRILELENRLTDLKLRFTEQHPDVIAVEETLASLKEQKRSDLTQHRRGVSDQMLEANPVYQQMKIALGESEARVASMEVRVREYQARVNNLSRLVNTVPEVEAQLVRLNRDYSVHKKNYDELVARRESAKISDSVGKVGDSVQFKVIDPPRVPFTPSGPDRLMFNSIVLAAGFIGGLAIAFLMSQINPVVYDRKTLNQISGYPVFGVVSRIWTPKMLFRRRLEFSAFVLSGLMLLLVYGGVLYMEITDNEYLSGLFRTLG